MRTQVIWEYPHEGKNFELADKPTPASLGWHSFDTLPPPLRERIALLKPLPSVPMYSNSTRIPGVGLKQQWSTAVRYTLELDDQP
jgi:hypothetical protein